MSIPPGTPSEGEGEGALSKKKNHRPFSIDWLGVQTIPWAVYGTEDISSVVQS